MGIKLVPFQPEYDFFLFPFLIAPHQWPMGFITPKQGKEFGHVVSCQKKTRVKNTDHRGGAQTPLPTLV